MTTKYDVGDIVLLPFVITEIHAYDKDDCNYEGYIKTDSEQPLGLSKEELEQAATIKTKSDVSTLSTSRIIEIRANLVRLLKSAGYAMTTISDIMQLEECMTREILYES